MTSVSHFNVINCFFCNGLHNCKECPVEHSISPYLKRVVGIMMEYYIANTLPCPGCYCNTLSVIGNNSPSLDITCLTCNKIFEVKSKCLSISKLPNDIIMHHGVYNGYLNKLNEGLNLIVIIYGVNRISKRIDIREILFIDNNDLYNNETIQVLKKPNSELSLIHIKNKNNLPRTIFKHGTSYLYFNNFI